LKDDENNFPKSIATDQAHEASTTKNALGGMPILRHRSAAAFLHNQDPKLTFALAGLPFGNTLDALAVHLRIAD